MGRHMIVRLLLLALLLPTTALAVDLSAAADSEIAVLAADPDWTIRVDAALEQARRADPDLTARRLSIPPMATRAGFMRFPIEYMNVPDAAPALLHRLRIEESAAVRGALADSLARQSAQWGDAVLELVAAEPEASVRAILVHALRFLPSDQAGKALQVGLSDTDATVRAEAARLVARRADGEDLSSQLVPALLDAHPTVRAAAAHSLGALRIEVSDDLLPLLDDQFGEVRLQALRALDRIDPVGTKRLARTRTLATDVDSRVARKAARILAD